MEMDDGIHAYASGAPWAVGGAERQQWLLARALAATGWSVQVGVRESLEAGARCMIDQVEFIGIGRGQILLAWYQFLASERPNWWYWRGAYHPWGPAVGGREGFGGETIFCGGFDSEVGPRRALPSRRRWGPVFAWGPFFAARNFCPH